MRFTRRLDSIRARMTAGFACFIAALMLTVCAAFFLSTKHADRRNADAALNSARTTLEREAQQQSAAFRDPAFLVREAREDWQSSEVALLILDAQQRVVAQSQHEVPVWPPRNDSWRTLDFSLGEHTVVLGVPWHKKEVALRERTLLLLLLSACVVAFSALGAWILVGRTLSPIDRLARGAQTASVENLQVRLQSPSPDAEMQRLVATLNDLLARLGETMAARGRFYAAASHELRTPLQALTGHLEVALSRPRDAHSYQSALQEAHAQAERLTTLVQDLLLLNQLDADTSRPPLEWFDLADLCESELAPLRALAVRRELQVALSLPAACELHAPWNHATMLLRNLLENAIKYATSGSKVQVVLSENALSIANSCAEIPDWNPDKYFEPFFRPDASRNSQTGGNGLGLAICKAIADNNGWTLNLTQHNGQICAVVHFGTAPVSTDLG